MDFTFLDALPPAWRARALAAVATIAAVAAGLVIHWLLFDALRRIAPRTDAVLDTAFGRHCAAPSRWIFPLLALNLTLPAVELLPATELVVGRLLLVGLIVSFAWFFLRLTLVLKEAVLANYDVAVADNLQARRVHTQVEIVRKILVVAIVLVALAAVLMSFDRLREVGAGLLASAGLAGIALGFAAQRTLGNLLAGFQIAITQPIRIDDVVVVEGEWGRVEEITLTFVVVRIWDQRRLVLPISYFLEKPFQNWTRVTAEVLGTVHVHLDYRVPVEEVRAALGRIVEANPNWDGRVWNLQVTDAGERTVELRALMSAADASTAWTLRTEVRERLLAHLRENHPEALPRVRAELQGREEAVGEAA